MNDIRIILQDSELDIKGDFGVPLNYSVSDVKDPSKRNANYSKTVTLAGSKNNNKLLGGLFDINADFTFFNPNFKTAVHIIVNSTTVIKGFLRLTAIDIVNEAFIEGDSVEYKCVISSATSDFWSAIQDKELNELDFSAKDHVLTHANIVSSWSNIASDVYTYPILHKNSLEYSTSDFKLAIFEKAYLKRIALEAGYGLTGDLMDETTVEGLAFSKDIITYNGDTPTIIDSEKVRRKFQAATVVNDWVQVGTINAPSAYQPWQGFNSSTPKIIEFNDDSTGTNFDNGGNFDTGTYSWTCDKNGSYSLDCVSNFNIVFNPTIDLTLVEHSIVGNGGNGTPNGTADKTFRLAVGTYVNGVLKGTTISSADLTLPATMLSGSSPTLTTTVNYSTPSMYLNTNDVVTFRVSVVGALYSSALYLFYAQTGLLTNQVDVGYIISLTSSVCSNGTALGAITDGDDVVISSYIPDNIKQSDILTDIIKRYNAYITVDEDNDSVIRIETRDGFYARGGTKDWTNKKDYSQKDTIVLLSELQQKEVLLSYKKDTDDYNKNYTTSVGGEIYGQERAIYDNEFIKGTKKIETPFSSTPLIYSDATKTMVVPSISTASAKTNPRVLHYGGLLNCVGGGSWNFNHHTGGVDVTTNYTNFPYSGHYDNPFTPSYSINFGEVPYEYYSSLQNTTTLSLYNRFWKNYIEQINEGKKITMSFNLNEVDISFIKDNLNTKIFVRDAYYYINKIIDYNPVVKGTTKVELLKIKDGVNFVGTVPIVTTDENDYTPVDGSVGSPDIPITSPDDALSSSEDTSITGSFSTIGTSSRNSMVSGDDSHVGNDSPNSLIVGDNNVIMSGVEGGFIIGTSDKTITESNTGYIGETFYRDGLVAAPLTSYLFTEVIALRDAETLIKGASYFISDLNLSFKALDNRTLCFITEKTLRVVEASLYASLGVFNPTTLYALNDRIIWGGQVWQATGYGADSDMDIVDAIDDYTLDTNYFTLETDETYYDYKCVEVTFSEEDLIIVKTRDEKDNVVNSTDPLLHLFSDWNDNRIYNNITAGFINNDVTSIYSNIVEVIKSNYNNGSIFENRNNGNITYNSSDSGTTFDINNNTNNGSIDYNNSTANITISNNINNGYIGTTTVTDRSITIYDSSVNK